MAKTEWPEVAEFYRPASFGGCFVPPPQRHAGPLSWRRSELDFTGSLVTVTTVCKHGLGPCETCGTTNQRDVRHSTRNGWGVVGSLIKR